MYSHNVIHITTDHNLWTLVLITKVFITKAFNAKVFSCELIFSHPYTSIVRRMRAKRKETDQNCCRSTTNLAQRMSSFFCCRSQSQSFQKWNRAFRSSNVFTNIEMTDVGTKQTSSIYIVIWMCHPTWVSPTISICNSYEPIARSRF